MRKLTAALVAGLLTVLLGACSGPAPEPEHCNLCESIPHHAPCVINLNTGEVGEIALYQPHFTLGGEIAEEQRGGYFCFLTVAGMHGYLNTSTPEAHVSAPIEGLEYNEKSFCFECRERLQEYTKDGFVLADLKEADNITLYPVKDGTEFTVRCYTVTVIENDKNELEISVIGSIPTDE